MSCTDPELPALPDALEERHEVPRDLVLLVLEADGALAVVRLDAVVTEASMIPALDDHAPRRLGQLLELFLDEASPVLKDRSLLGGTDFILGVVEFFAFTARNY